MYVRGFACTCRSTRRRPLCNPARSFVCDEHPRWIFSRTDRGRFAPREIDLLRNFLGLLRIRRIFSLIKLLISYRWIFVWTGRAEANYAADAAIICVEFYLQGADIAPITSSACRPPPSPPSLFYECPPTIVGNVWSECVCISDYACPLTISLILARLTIDDRDDWCDFGTIDLGTVPTALKISSDRVSPRKKKKKKVENWPHSHSRGPPSCRSDDRWIPDKSRARKKCCSETVRFPPADPGRSWPVEATTIWSSTGQAKCPANRHLRARFPSGMSSNWVPDIWRSATTLEG